MAEVTRQTSVSNAIAITPRARRIFRAHGIEFIGKQLSPLESIEIVARGNNLTEEKIDLMIKEINESMKEKDLPPEHAIKLTDKAAAKLKELLRAKKGKKGFRLRLASDGCGLYTYDIDFGTKAIGEELALSFSGLKFYIEKKFLSLLYGTEIDYDPSKDGFVFNNPNVKD